MCWNGWRMRLRRLCRGRLRADTLLGRTPGDWDVTTAARPEQVLALFDGYAIPTGLKHGTVTVRAGEMHIEVTTFRADGTYTDPSPGPDPGVFLRQAGGGSLPP